MKGLLLACLIILPLTYCLDESDESDELIIKKLVSLSKNKRCQKVERDDVVTMHFMAKLPDGKIITPYTKNVKFQMGSKGTMLGIGRVASELCIGERAEATLPSYTAYQGVSCSFLQESHLEGSRFSLLEGSDSGNSHRVSNIYRVMKP